MPMNPQGVRFPDGPNKKQSAADCWREVARLRALVLDVQEALDTDKEGQALVEVARGARSSEKELAALIMRVSDFQLRKSMPGLK